MQRYKPTSGEARALANLDAELGSIRLGHRSVLDEILPDVRQLLGTDSILMVSPEARGDGLDLAKFHADGLPDPAQLAARFRKLFRAVTRRYAWFDAIRPEPEQRNRVLEAHDVIPAGEFEQSAVYHKVLLPLGLHTHRQPRVLLCDGPSLLAWFGAFHDGVVTTRQKQLLRKLVPGLQRRLGAERRLAAAPRSFAALEACLEQLGSPAFVVGASGEIFEANRAGRALLATRSDDVRRSLHDGIAERPTVLPFALTRLAENGAATGYLAILPPTSRDERIRAAVARASERWRLTQRQTEVLEQVVAGHATTTIAAILGVSDRAIELHVTAMFEISGVDSRAALTSCVLLLE